MGDNFVETVIELHRSKSWKEILNLNTHSDNQNALKLLWVWPEIKNIRYIKNLVKDLGYKGIISLGCGCGLLEWIISEATGLPVLGYEINPEWWESKYSNYKFINLHYVDSISEKTLDSNYALLFCYFNDREAFQKYVENYRGNLIFIIGPGDETCRHTDPEPFSADFGSSEWKLYCFQEVKSSGDYIAAYVREERSLFM
ncbi:uncharacterized protein LOC114326869 [Diabrotica virgifera virgifera]|uniref:Uncharacterized protein LOC114326869 n=1 Tax=Diabrotica virgifera virgifera TaxID=50390 RepID=A0A6P7FCF1_DIAVI|nr:uncharacterized protein LOC114326869 [Diabrotica virgifera virgifera]XP_050504808.1 uncharacterized protein LOC114326869 [Diabrotica virgifera virgifera]